MTPAPRRTGRRRSVGGSSWTTAPSLAGRRPASFTVLVLPLAVPAAHALPITAIANGTDVLLAAVGPP